jgi:thiamine biosynthesis protein ThiS
MTIIVNGQPVPLNAPATVAQVLEQLQLPHLRVAVEVNQTVVPRSQWTTQTVNDGDRLEVVQFVGGGC